MNLPTKITVARMCLIPLMVVFFYVDFVGHYLCAGLVYILSASTDFIDGYIARSRNMVTNLGKLLDPLADKVLTVVALFLIVELRVLYMLGPFLCGLILARELLIGGIRQIAATKNVVLQADKLGKAKTIFTNIALPTLIISQFFLELGAKATPTFETLSQFDSLSRAYWGVRLAGNILFVVAFVLTILSAVNYVMKNYSLLSKLDNNEETDKVNKDEEKNSTERGVENNDEEYKSL